MRDEKTDQGKVCGRPRPGDTEAAAGTSAGTRQPDVAIRLEHLTKAFGEGDGAEGRYPGL